ncbi:MAG: glycosyltransferase family 4 protein [Pirellulales bacterium]|nr:glycosyltransferase family 4 protein [Pirellulales bacterium]
MHILILTDRFVPEITAPSFREMEHAQEWVRMGHEVTVVTCAPNFPHGKVFPGYRNRCYQVEWMDGIRVIRIWSYMAANVGSLKRTLDYLSYVFSAIFFFWRYPKFDVIVASSPPLFVPIAGYAISRLRRRPWVFEIRDLWPATIEAVGAGRGRMLKWLTRLEMFLYRKADHIIPLTDSFKDDLTSRGVPAAKIDVVTNGVDTHKFNRDNVRFDARERLGVAPDKFLAAYVGTIGMCQGLETMVDAAEQCRDNPDVVLLMMGEGAERATLEAEARRRGLDNLLFHDFVPHEEVISYLGALDATIVHLRPHPLFKTVIPSKIFESMAMGVPMIYAVEGHSAEIVEKAGAGICIPSGDPEAMAHAVLELARNPEKRKQLSEDGQAAVSREYSRRAKAEDMIHILEKPLARAGRSGAAKPADTESPAPAESTTRREERS